MSLNSSLGEGDAPSSVDVDGIMDHVVIVFYTLTVVLGITGNSVVIWVTGFQLKPNVTNVWLVNLAVADLIFCFTRVFSLVKKLFFEHWPFGTFLCKFNGFFKYANMFCSVFLLAAISLDRALCVWLPVFTKRHRTVWTARCASLCIWVSAVIFSTPYFVYRQVYLGKGNLSKCSLEVKNSGDESHTPKLALYSIRFLCGFLLPFLVILTCYVLAAVGIKRTRLLRKKRSLRIVASLVVAFFLCWGPYHCLLLVKMIDAENLLVKVWHPIAKCVAYFNSCVNPLLYFCLGLNASRGVRQSLTKVYRRALANDVDAEVQGSLDDSSGSKNTSLTARTSEGRARI
ncbi:C3a anaphylatoxin chemotactic receptor-like [Neosynchiropus ocellatus]